MISLTINGKTVELAGPLRLTDYLHGIGVDSRGVAVEINERILDRSEFETATLAQGDVVEVVRMVGGGSFARGGPSKL